METTGGLAGLGGMSSGSWLNDLYRTYFGRDADAEGANFWLGTGLGQDEIASHLAASPEALSYLSAQGQPSTDPRADYIKGLYTDLLGRAPDDGGFDFWMNSGLDEYGLYDEISSSQEARSFAIADMYRDFMGRDPDESGMAFWDATGLGINDLAYNLYTSPEAQVYLAAGQFPEGPYRPWEMPLAPLEGGGTRDDLQAFIDVLRPHFRDEVISGFLSNGAVESYLNPQQYQLDDYGKPIIKRDGTPRGFGMFQWGNERLWGIDPGNKALGLEKFAEQYGLDPRTGDAQGRFTLYELYNNPYYRRNLKEIQGARTPAEAARAISNLYVAPGKPHIDRRLNLAPQFFDWLKQGSPADAEFLKGIRRIPLPLNPGFPPLRPDQQWIDQNYSPGPGSSYQGPSIDPMTGQWTDPSMNGFLQPTLQASSPFLTNPLENVFQPYTIASSSGVQPATGTPGNFMSDPFGQTGGWGISPDPYGPFWTPPSYDSSTAVS